ncbi:MAG: hypothetical protein HC906_20035, partial [Bacteroidales bacterium]|nr:hypothetical protein [Bacteroidales bacterium]
MLAFVDKIIADVIKKEEEARLREQERMLDEQFGRDFSMQNTAGNITGTGEWYFYNEN